MKHIALIIAVLLSVLTASAQHDGHNRSHHNDKRSYHQDSGHRHGGFLRHHESRGHRQMELERHRMDNSRRHIDKGHRSMDNGHRHGGHGDILCTGEWQELWNGCHVRLKLDKVYIYDRRGDRVLWGDEVVLLRNGTYKVYNGTFWYVHDADGDRIFNLWGDSVELMGGDRYRIYRSGNYHYFDWNGNELR